MRVARWLLIIVAFSVMLYECALPGDLPADNDNGTGLAGTWSVNGIDPTNAEFSGTAVLVNTDDPDVYDLSLVVTGSIQKGRAVRRGSRVDVTWEAVDSADGPVTGTGLYTVMPDGTLQGIWQVDGSSTEGTITLYPDP